MAPTTPAELPARAWFKASEVCDIAQVQPFILRSWEKEFPDLGVAKTPGAARLYRKGDVARVLQIKDLLFVEGLTLAGARRRLEQDKPEAATEPESESAVFVSDDLRVRIGKVKDGLSGLMTMLGDSGVAGRMASSADGEPTGRMSAGATDFALTQPAVTSPAPRPASRPPTPGPAPRAQRGAARPPGRRRA